MQGQYEEQQKIIQSLEHQLAETRQQLNDAGSASAAVPDAQINSSVDQGLHDISCDDGAASFLCANSPASSLMVNNSLAMADPRLHETSCDASLLDTTSETFLCPHPPPSSLSS